MAERPTRGRDAGGGDAADLRVALDASSFQRAAGSLAGLAFNFSSVFKGVAALPGISKPLVGAANSVANAFRPIEAAARSTTERVVGALKDVVTEFGAMAARLSSTSLQFGISTQALQGLEAPIGVAGVGADALRGSLGSLQQKMYETTTENAEATKAFNRLGVSVRAVGGGFKPVTQVWQEGLEKLIAIEDPTIRAGKAMATLGEAGLQVANYWRDKGGIAAFKEFQKSVEGFGVVLDRDIRAAGDFRSESFRLGLVLKDFKNDAAGPLSQVLADVSKDLFGFVKASGPAGSASKPLRESMERLGHLRGPLSESLKTAFSFAKDALPALVTVMGAVANVTIGSFTGIADAFKKMGDAGYAVAAGLFVAFAPHLALFTGLALLLNSFVRYTQGRDSFVGDAIESVKKAFVDLDKKLAEEPGTVPFLLRFARELIRIFQKDIPEAYDKLKGKLDIGFLKTLDKGAAQIEQVLGVNKGSARFKATKEENEIDLEASKRLGFFGRVKSTFGSSEFDALREQVRGERAAGLQSKGPDYSALVSAPAATQPLVPYPAPASRSVAISAPVTLTIQGQVLDAKGLMSTIKPQLEEAIEETLVSAYRSAQP